MGPPARALHDPARSGGPCSEERLACSQPRPVRDGCAPGCGKVRRPMKGRMPWAAVAAFWVFIAVLDDGQILWLSRMPGERIDLRAAFAWQTVYYLLWIPLTLIVWRLTAGWIPESSRDWARTIGKHLLLFTVATMVHFAAV